MGRTNLHLPGTSGMTVCMKNHQKKVLPFPKPPEQPVTRRSSFRSETSVSPSIRNGGTGAGGAAIAVETTGKEDHGEDREVVRGGPRAPKPPCTTDLPFRPQRGRNG